ncbi:MAG TPA: tRNA epoxyqueuosine(34) reductase QueG [Gammaproteobacteria bacterium]|nr:tRNA epoxyqueuosine(34) reductase QueG [Gammaproteobacteria bacterium]
MLNSLKISDKIQLSAQIKQWGLELGFQQVGITDTHLDLYEARLHEWLAKNYHGSMDYMQKHGEKRSQPDKLIPGTLRIISVRMDYLPPDSRIKENLINKTKAYIARYALGRDYHKVLRRRLKKLADKIQENIGPFGFRAFVDSAPVLEKPIGEKAGLGWIGKNTLLINKKAGSYFFLGEIYTDLDLPIDIITDTKNHCGSCTACIDICPTKAIIAPHVLDARKCISYLTIENKSTIPVEFREAIGNRIFGCDDCQLCCPWNKFAKFTQETDFHPRHELDNSNLIDLFLWDEQTFLTKTTGSAIRRAGYEGWLRNLAVGLGNAPSSPEIIAALKSREEHPSEMVREHVRWALEVHLAVPRKVSK